LKLNDTPKHIAVIMDGNGRWAKNHKLPRVIGHREGTKATKKIVQAAGELGLQYLTLYVFSSENWNRPRLEITALMRLLIEKIHQEIDELDKKNVSLQAMGDLSRLPVKTLQELDYGIQRTSKNIGLQLILALSYGGRQEIVDTCRKIAEKIQCGEIAPDAIDEALFKRNMYKPDVPDPDLLIRTGGDMRVSNYLLWQIAYTELYVTPTLWPDFDKPELMQAISSFTSRQRRFGKVLET
jgi:undecaprenyl diphosphate synthase